MENKKPLDFWVSKDQEDVYNEHQATYYNIIKNNFIHVREVIPDDEITMIKKKDLSNFQDVCIDHLRLKMVVNDLTEENKLLKEFADKSKEIIVWYDNFDCDKAREFMQSDTFKRVFKDE